MCVSFVVRTVMATAGPKKSTPIHFEALFDAIVWILVPSRCECCKSVSGLVTQTP